MTYINCSVCYDQIDASRIVGGKAYCSCGNILQLSSKKVRDTRSAVSIFLFGMVMVLSIIHAINWDTYFFAIIPLKVKQLVGKADFKDYNSIAKICQDRKKTNCELEALQAAYKLEKKNDLLVRTGEILMDQKKYASAVANYSTYFHSKGDDDKARTAFAQALALSGQYDLAKAQYSYLITKSKGKPQFQVARSYVELLLKNNDYASARSVIYQFRSFAPSANLFLEKELKVINNRLPASALTANKTAIYGKNTTPNRIVD